MTSLVLTNNAQSTIDGTLAIGATTLNVAAGQGALFPNPGANEWFPLTLIAADGSSYEIVRATARTTDAITIIRAQEGTSDLAFANSDIVSHRMTAAALLDLANQGIDTIQTATGSVNAYAISLSALTAYADGQSFQFIPNLSNTATATLTVNALAAVGLRKYSADGLGTLEALSANDIIDAQAASVHYENSSGFFILDNPVVADIPTATGAIEGTVILASDPQTYSIGGNNTKPVTQKTASQIVEQAVSAVITPAIPAPWRYYGAASSPGGNVTINSSTLFVPGVDQEYESLDLQVGGSILCEDGSANVYRGVLIIRATVSITIDGVLELPDAPIIYNGGERHVGPAGTAPDTTFNAEYRQFQEALVGLQAPGGHIQANYVRAAIKQGVAMPHFIGGIGTCRWTQTHLGRKDYDAGTVPASDQPWLPCGGCILIAPVINIGANAQIVMSSRYRTPTSTDAGDAGGGMLLASCPAAGLTVDAGAQFAAGMDSTDFQSSATWASDRSLLLAGTNVAQDGSTVGDRHAFAWSGQFMHVQNDVPNVIDIF